MRTFAVVCSLALSALASAGCTGGSSSPAPSGGAASASASAAPEKPVITDKTRRQAKEKFETICASCHGEGGEGNGAGAAALKVKPRNFTDKSWQAGITDEQIEQTILLGGAAMGKSAEMPAHPIFKETPALLAALREHVRNLGAK